MRTPHTTRNSRRRQLGGLAGAVAALFVAGAVQAAPVERSVIEVDDAWTFTRCGFEVAMTLEGTVRVIAKEGRAGDPTPLLLERYDLVRTATNTATGASLTILHNGLLMDVRVTHVTGTVYEFLIQEAGRPFVVMDADGNLLVHDRGRLLSSIRIDTLGDQDPTNDIVFEESWELLADNGAHPGFYIDFCAILSDAIG